MRGNRMSVMRSVNGTIGSTLRATGGATGRTAAMLLAVLCLVAAGCARTGSSVREQDRPRKFPPLALDKETGHYKDLSYEALSDEGLSLEQRSWLFGGETIHYGPLTDARRTAKQRELEKLLAKIDVKLVAKCEGEIRKWLDQRIAAIPAAYAGRDVWQMRAAAVTFFRAYEVLGDKKHLDAGLKCADKILAKQWPKGHWPWGRFHEDFVRIQDGLCCTRTRSAATRSTSSPRSGVPTSC